MRNKIHGSLQNDFYMLSGRISGMRYLHKSSSELTNVTLLDVVSFNLGETKIGLDLMKSYLQAFRNFGSLNGRGDQNPTPSTMLCLLEHTEIESIKIPCFHGDLFPFDKQDVSVFCCSIYMYIHKSRKSDSRTVNKTFCSSP